MGFGLLLRLPNNLGNRIVDTSDRLQIRLREVGWDVEDNNLYGVDLLYRSERIRFLSLVEGGGRRDVW